MKKLILLLTLCLTVSFIDPMTALSREKISVAVAVNFISAFKVIELEFEKRYGIEVEAAFSSTGNLYSQIVNGAPYDLFLSADESRPFRLFKNGLAEQPFVYTRGQVILWSADKNFCKQKNWQEALKDDPMKKIAIANPLTAPYGAAAKAALQKAGLWDAWESKLVYAQSVAQSFHYANTYAVKAGFCAMSASTSREGKKGCYYAVTEAADIIQSACILKRTENRALVERLAAFLVSPEGQNIKVKYGYH